MLCVRQEELLLSLLLLTVCPPGYFGEGCEEHCDCIHGLSCHHQTGACHCQKGWRGKHCDKREYLLDVYRGRFTLVCTFLMGPELMMPPPCCSCGVHLKVLMRMGAPDPLEQWVALHHPACPLPSALTRICCIIAACLPGRYGVGCAQRCQCPAGTPCHHLTGKCSCPPGFTGYGCEKSKFYIRMHIAPL